MHIHNAQLKTHSSYEFTSKQESEQQSELIIDRIPTADEAAVSSPPTINATTENPVQLEYSNEQKQTLILLERMFGLQQHKHIAAVSKYETNHAQAHMAFSFEAQTDIELGFRFNYHENHRYTEQEYSNIQFAGEITSNQGSFEISLQLEQSRSLYQESSLHLSFGTLPVDPLVLAVESSDVSFTQNVVDFDINADSQSDRIAQLQHGNYFLAIDKNHNQHIDDGSELFGPSSGQGFQELKQFDNDHNGFIDEKDDVFSALRLLKIHSNGSQELYTLNEKDIGAIATNSLESPFSFKDSAAHLADIKRSSFAIRDGAHFGQTIAVRELDFYI